MIKADTLFKENIQNILDNDQPINHGVTMLTLATPFLRAVSLTLAPEPMFSVMEKQLHFHNDSNSVTMLTLATPLLRADSLTFVPEPMV